MSITEVLKPKSLDDVKKIVENFSEYRIKYNDHKGKLQYKKRIKFLWIFSWWGWRNVYKYKYSSNANEIKEILINDDEERDLNKFTAKHPIATKFMEESLKKAKADQERNNGNRCVYLNKKLIINNSAWDFDYIKKFYFCFIL